MFGRSRRLQLRILETIINLGANIMATLDDIKALADQNATLTATLIGTVNTEAQNIAALQAQLAAVVPADPDAQTKIDAIAAELTSTVGNLTAATTTAAPAAAPTPAA